MEKLPVVGVMGSGSIAHEDLAWPLGRWIAQEGYHLLTGGGSGVMACVSRAFCEENERKGKCIGIIPAGPPAGYPNPWVEIPIYTHLSSRGLSGMDTDSRNHINILSSDVIIALPGGPGTRSEVGLSEIYTKPLIAYIGNPEDMRDLPSAIPRSDNLEEVKSFVRQNLHFSHGG